ncbi:MAG: type II toxin-antitoxin system prevent-host-death family antitoxin [Actinomycetota bacterium]|nr:type II toxin-antitoxin system prevent-host-death family antitoxin [Actinomycetota bacterium]
MERVSVREVRENLRAYLERAESGEEISILRRGKEVARLVPPERKPGRFPDLTEFRASIKLKGESVSESLIKTRREARY